MGAWIEIYGIDLKSTLLIVAPLVGAWIEIIKALISCKWFFVAPLVGAWIEIEALDSGQKKQLSLLSWERGLKCPSQAHHFGTVYVAPLVGAWIEISSGTVSARSRMPSLLSWERGLKLKNLNTNDCVIWSLLSWERGLKFCKVSGCACTCRRSSRGSVN